MSKHTSPATRNIIKNILFHILPVLGLLIPAIITIATYKPVLTQDLADELSFAHFLSEHGSHTFAEGWISTKPYFPLAPRFFLTFFPDILGSWRGSYLKAILCSYAVFSVSYIFFAFSFRAKKLIPYLILTVLAFGAGFASLRSAVCGSLLIAVLAFFFAFLGFLALGIFGIPFKTETVKKPVLYSIKILISLLCIVPFLFAFKNIKDLSDKYEFGGSALSSENIGSLFVFSTRGEDLKKKLGPLAERLYGAGITDILSTSEITNGISVLTGGKVNVIHADIENGLSPLPANDTKYSFINDETVNFAQSLMSCEPFYLLYDNDTLKRYQNTSKTKYADTGYSDDLFSITVYENIDYLFDEALIADLSDISENDHPAYFISMYDVSYFDPADFELYMGWKPYVIKKSISDERSLRYLDKYNSYIFDKKPAESKDDTAQDEIINPERMYLGIDPLVIREIAGEGDLYVKFVKDRIVSVIEKHDTTDFQIVFPGYCISHYADLSDKYLSDLPDLYEKLVSCLSDLKNVSYHFLGTTDWICYDPYLFENGSDIRLKKEESTRVLSNILAAYYLSSPEEVVAKAEELKELIISEHEKPRTYADLSDTCLVILGDSIFDLFRDNSSIQNIIENFSGAKVLCKAVGGSPAAVYHTLGKDEILSGQLSDIRALDSEIREAMGSCSRLVFIIEFGLNDYFLSIKANDPAKPFDPETYGGAIRTAADTIQIEWPEAEIILMSPGYVAIADNGLTPFTEGADILPDYRKTSAEVAEEFNLHLYDLTTQPGITQDTFLQYSYMDLVHYNESGRLLVAESLINYISKL